MAVNIKRLLKKGNLTGREVGQALLLSTATSYERTLKGISDGSIDVHAEDATNAEGVFTDTDLKNMIGKLKESWDIKQYNKHVHINSYITSELGYASAYSQQALAGFLKLMHYVKGILDAERNISTIMKTPCIMTQAQYEFYSKQATEEQRGYEMCYFDIYTAIANNYLLEYEDNPSSKKNPLAAVYRKYEKQAFKDKDFLARYKKTYAGSVGHYETKDGISQSEVTADEWEKIVNEFLIDFRDSSLFKENYYDKSDKTVHDLAFDIKQIKDRYKPTNDNMDSPIFEYFHWVEDDITEVQGKGNIRIILQCYDIFEYVDNVKMAEKEYSSFVKAFPELDAAIMKVFRELYPKEADYPIKDMDKVITTWGEMIDNNILSREIMVVPTDDLIAQYVPDQSMRARISFTGIAILRDDCVPVKMYDVDEQGFYKEPEEMSAITYSGSIDEIMSDDDTLSDIESTLEYQLEDSLRELYAYNEINKLISEYSDVDLSIFAIKGELENLEAKIEAYNALCLQIRRRMQGNISMFGKEITDKKYNAFCTIFPLIDIENYKPLEENIAVTRDYITKTEDAFAVHTPNIGRLMKRKGDSIDYE